MEGATDIGTSMTIAPAQNLPWTRLLLIVSAAVALVSVSMSLLKSHESNPPPVSGEQNAPDIDEVIARLEDRLKQDPSSAEGWRLLGWTYSQASRPADAVRAYRRATEIDPGKADLWAALGEAMVLAGQQGFPDEARAAFGKALALDPKNVGARFFLGAAKAESGDAKGAIDDWIALLDDAPADAPWAMALRQKVEEIAAANKIDVASRLSSREEGRH